MQQLEPIYFFLRPLNASGIEYFVTGSVASIFYGEPRLTHDIDLVVHLSEKNLDKFSSLFPIEKFYCPPTEVLNIEIRRRPFGHFNLIHHGSGFKADIYPDAGDRLHQWAFENRKQIKLGGEQLWLAPPEYVIIRKLEYYREGGSDKHIQDIEKMLPQIQSNLDESFLKKEIADRQLTNYWNKVRR